MTAVALAAATSADECQIYTDVDGIYSCDPRIIPSAHKLDQISIQEMLEMAQSGAKVMQSQAMVYAAKTQTPLRILSSFEPGEGTLIQYQVELAETAKESASLDKANIKVTGIALALSQCLIVLSYKPSQQKQITQILAGLMQNNIYMDDFGPSEPNTMAGMMNCSWVVADDDQAECIAYIEAFFQQSDQAVPPLALTPHLAKLSLVGVGLGHAECIQKQLLASLDGIKNQVYAQKNDALRLSILLSAQCVESVAQRLHHQFIEADHRA